MRIKLTIKTPLTMSTNVVLVSLSLTLNMFSSYNLVFLLRTLNTSKDKDRLIK